MRLAQLTESNVDVIVNPSRREFDQFMNAHYQLGRMKIVDGNVIIWDAYEATHDDINRRFPKHNSGNPLEQVSMYAFLNNAAVRLYDVGDEEMHPLMTKLARQNSNMVAIWGTDVIVIDMHGEP